MLPTLRQRIKRLTGQDIGRCQACLDCDVWTTPEMDISFGMLIQLALLDEAEVFATRTLWSEEAFRKAKGICKQGLDLQAVIAALRQIAAETNLSV